MKCEIAPAEVSELLPFQCAIKSGYVSKVSEAAFGGVSKNSVWCWICKDTTINTYLAENSEWFGGYCFGQSLKDPSAKITAVAEFKSTHISFPCLLIAVDNDNESIVCMYNINTSKVFRSILIPDRVLSIEVVSGNGGACVDTYYLYAPMRSLFGIIALGTSSGHVYFLDLCLDEDFPCDENLPDITYIIDKYELQPERRERAISKQQHIFILLNDQSTRSGSFELESRSSSLGHFPYGKARVTALKYIPSTITLAVGFSFGGAQLWNLKDLCLLYTFAYEAHHLPVISFAFQEPENDPRNFCYLWIIRGYSANERPEEASVASMYSLTYAKKTYEKSYGNLYMDIQCCSKRFEYTLTSDPVTSGQSSSFAGSCILSCQTVCQTDELHALDVSSLNDSDTAPENMSLCFISWLVWSNSGNSPASCHLALFDLNQWYQAQMPASNYRCDPSDLNPFLAHYALEEVVQIFDEELLLGLCVVPHNIRKFKYISPAEEFFYPSSLDFQTILYSAHAICKASFLGLQKSLLYKIGELGPRALINPKDLYTDLIRYGLVSDTAGNCGERVPLITQRETILHLALEYHLPYFFMKCLKEWRYADSIQEGCTSRDLLDWSWRKVIHIKSSIDKLNLPFFNCSGIDIDKASLKCLYSYRRQLDLIDTIFTGYQKFATPPTEQGIQELKCKKDVVFSISTYLQVILWLQSVHILPEVSEGDETEKNVLYPVNRLINLYNERRSQIRNIHSTIGPTDLLLIDGLVKEAFSKNTWQEKGGNGIYPPPSIYAALSCYLLDGVHLDLKHSLMYYLLLDICYLSPRNSFISEIEKFPAVFEMSQSVAKLVKAFWYLDQLKFEVAIKKLLHPAVKTTDILPWQHRRVIKSFLFRGEAQKALRFINHMQPPENTLEDMKLHLSVLLGKGAIIQAFEYQRSKQAEGFGKELLNHLFLGCQQTQKLKDLMYMPLNTFESSSLVKFLSENDDPCAQEALVMYHLLRCNFFEASKVNEKLAISLSGKTSSTNRRTADREALVEGLLSSVPKTERKLVNEINRFPSVPVRKNVELKPLSLSVKNAPLKQISYSDILNSLISDANSAMCAPYLEPQTPLKAVGRSNYDNIPFLRPPLAPEFTRSGSEVTPSTPVIKRALLSPSSEYSSPTKKSRLLDNAAFRTSPLMKKKIPKHLAGDVASLLQSPPINRRGSKLARDGCSPLVPPQGILKKKTEPSKVSASDIYTSRTPPLLSDAMESDDSEAADSDSEKMIVDDAMTNDVPGRQIRFSVPLKEDLNASALSVSDADSSILSVRDEPTSFGTSRQSSGFVKKIEDMKNISLRTSFSEREFINVTRRKSLLSLTRVPLKSRAKASSEMSLFSSEGETIVKTSSEVSSSICLPSAELKGDKIHEICEENSVSSNLCDLDNADKITSTHEDAEQMQDGVDSESVQDSNHSLAALSDLKRTALTRETLSHLSSSESILNRSGSSSGNSSYNSASERSLTITPRRPLRDGSRNVSTSDISVTSAVEEKMEDTVLGAEKEKPDDADLEIIDEESKEPFVKEYDDADIKIIDEVIHNPDESATEDIICEDKSDDSDIKIIEDAAIEQCKETEPSKKEATHIGKTDIFFTDVTIVQRDEDPLVHQTLSTMPECSKANTVIEIEKMENIVHNKEDCGNQNQDNVEENESNKTVQEELSSHSDKMEVNASENLPSVPDSECQNSITVDSELIVQPKQADNTEISTPSFDIYDFEKDTSSASSIPAYVPIRERINKTSYKDTSDFQTFENLEDTSRDSLSNSSHKQIQQPVEEGIKENKLNLAEELTISESLPRLSQEACGSETKVASSDPMEVEISEIEESEDGKKILSTPSPTLSREFFSERFDFLSKNSDMYENTKLYKEAMNILKESDISQNIELYGENKPSRQTKTFIFSKERTKSSSKSAKKASSKDSNLKSVDEKPAQKEFLDSWKPETYEQFSSSIAKDGSEAPEKMTLRSSPNTDREKNSAKTADKSDETEYQALETKGKSRKQDLTRRNTSIINRKQKSPIKKAKEKGKGTRLTRKMEFSFAEPHSPAGPEILEALTSPSEHPVGSFMFSPPLTRGRLRQRKLDDTLGSSFASVASETSFGGRSKKPPVDPILQGIITERSEDPRKPVSTSKSQTRSAKKKITTRKSKTDLSHLEDLDSSLDISKVVDVSQELSTSKVLSSAKYTGKHTMVLRQAKVKPRKEQL